jgi:tripartite-type tricarboxylate transporter receptor subunit TctC
MSDSLVRQGVEPAGGTPEKFAALIKSEVEKYTEVVKAAHIRVE